MRRIALFFWIVLFSFSTARGQIQSEVGLSRIEVDLWPEFDRPTMLIIYKITISAQTKLPVEIRLRIPSLAGSPNAVAARQPEGSLFNIPYDQELSGEWSILTFTATAPEIQIEYYDPTLTKQDTKRHFEYRWTGDYAIDSFFIQVQEPIGASEMRFSPSLGPGQRAGDGMVYYTQEIGSLSLGQSFSIVMDYQKANDDLSAESVPVEASGPLDSTTAGWQSMISALPWLLGLLGVFLIIGGGLWYWQSGRKTTESEKRSFPRRRKPSPAQQVNGAENEYIYCHQCGKRALPGDRFCRTCGTQLRLG